MDLIKKKGIYTVLFCVLLTCITTTNSENQCQAIGQTENNRLIDIDKSTAIEGVVAVTLKTTRVFGDTPEDRLAACVDECCKNDQCTVATVSKKDTGNTETNCEFTQCYPLDKCIWMDAKGHLSSRVGDVHVPPTGQPKAAPTDQPPSTVYSTTIKKIPSTLPPTVKTTIKTTVKTTVNVPTEPAAPSAKSTLAPAGPTEGPEPTPKTSPSPLEPRSTVQPTPAPRNTPSTALTESPKPSTPQAAKSTARPTPAPEVPTPKASTPPPPPPTEIPTPKPTETPSPPTPTPQKTTLKATPSPTPSKPPTQPPTPLPTETPTPSRRTTTVEPTPRPTERSTLKPTPVPTEKVTEAQMVVTEPPTPVPQPVTLSTQGSSTIPPAEGSGDSQALANEQITRGAQDISTTPRNKTMQNISRRINNEEIKNRSNTKAALIAALVFGTLFTISVIALVTKRFYESWQRRHYQKVDYLIEGLYNK